MNTISNENNYLKWPFIGILSIIVLTIVSITFVSITSKCLSATAILIMLNFSLFILFLNYKILVKRIRIKDTDTESYIITGTKLKWLTFAGIFISALTTTSVTIISALSTCFTQLVVLLMININITFSYFIVATIYIKKKNKYKQYWAFFVNFLVSVGSSVLANFLSLK